MREKSSANQGTDPENPENKKTIDLCVVITNELNTKKRA